MNITAAYPYENELGDLLFEVVRFVEPDGSKSFRPRRRPLPGDPSEAVRHGRGGVGALATGLVVWKRHPTLLLYRLPEVLDAVRGRRRIYVVEGEKDADNLRALGLTATTNPYGGSKGQSKWQPQYTETLRGARVLILPDNDETGRNHAHRVAALLQGVAASVGVLELPNLPPKGDVSDWLEAGGTAEELERLAMTARDPSPEGPVDERALECTDQGNGMRYGRLCGDQVRWCPGWKSWLVWTGRRWSMDGERPRRMFRCVLRDLLSTSEALRQEAKEADDEGDDKKAARLEARADRLHQWAQKSASARALQAALEVARADLEVEHEDLDNAPMLLNVANGTVDLRTGELRPHRREDLISQIASTAYDLDAECPRWLAFLDRIMGGNAELVGFLRRAVGYSLTGNVSEQCFFFLHGTGNNGKSVFLDTIRFVLGGGYARTAAPDMFLESIGDKHPTDIADLFRARFVTTSEPKKGRRLGEDLVKQLTGGDRRKARRMREDFWEYEPTDKVWMAANHKLQIRGTDWGIWRRVRLLPFQVTIPASEVDKRLAEKLQREAAGILQWAVAGCLEWQRDGLNPPAEVTSATATYRQEMDTLGQFIDEKCFVSSAPGVSVNATTIWKAYQEWAQDNGDRSPKRTAFTQAMLERGFTKSRGTGGPWFWDGIALMSREHRGLPSASDASDAPVTLDSEGASLRNSVGSKVVTPHSEVSDANFRGTALNGPATQPALLEVDQLGYSRHSRHSADKPLTSQPNPSDVARGEHVTGTSLASLGADDFGFMDDFEGEKR